MPTHEFTYHPATLPELDAIGDKNIADNPGNDSWIAWKESSIERHQAGLAKTFVVVRGDAPIGEGTLIFSPDVPGICKELADGATTVNINALRMDKRYESQGHISKLVKVMEQYARNAGYKVITIGVEARETRNLAIYLHWGFTTFVMSEMDDGELVLYYSKNL